MGDGCVTLQRISQYMLIVSGTKWFSTLFVAQNSRILSIMMEKKKRGCVFNLVVFAMLTPSVILDLAAIITRSWFASGEILTVL